MSEMGNGIVVLFIRHLWELLVVFDACYGEKQLEDVFPVVSFQWEGIVGEP